MSYVCCCPVGPNPAALDATEKYWHENLLDYGDTIGAIFYDPGRYSAGRERLQSLMELRSMRMLDNRSEVILVNYAEDRELQAFCVRATNGLPETHSLQHIET